MAVIILDKGEHGSEVVDRLQEAGAEYRMINLYGDILIVAWPDSHVKNTDLSGVGVKKIVYSEKPYVLASKRFREFSEVSVAGSVIRDGLITVVAGPCSVESEDQYRAVAEHVVRQGASILRGGAFKPRTSHYSFRGLGVEALKIIRRVKEDLGVPAVTEVLDSSGLRSAIGFVDAIQIGARNSQNFSLLSEAGRSGLPVFLKRGFGNTVEEWILSAEYVLLEGNGSVVLIERGIRTFEKSTRFTLDVGGIVVAKRSTHLPVIVDPSHPAGKRDLVIPLALAGIAAGADGVIVEVHSDPDRALSDAAQQLTFEQFNELMAKIRALADALGKKLFMLDGNV
jgi:3-deoxy-7-phosphoheptulonate synthase